MTPPKTWKKYGELYSDDRNKFIYVCSTCLENVEHIYFAFTTSDASDFWKHIQQHITADCEFLKEPTAKESHTEIQQKDCDNRNVNEIEDSTDYRTVDQVQNKIEMLDQFHESLVGNFGNTDKINKETETKESQHMDVKMENEMELSEFKMETQFTIKNEFLSENTGILNEDQDIQEKKNYSYDCDHEIYTISDDDEEDDEDDDEGDNDILNVVKERSARDYLAHNDMIELSDEDDLDEVDTRSNSPQAAVSDKEHNVVKQTEVASNHFAYSGYSYNCLSCHISFPNRNDLINHLETHEIEANAQQNIAANTFPIDSVNCIPTPAASPNDIIHNQDVATVQQPYKCNYCPQRFFEIWQLDRHQRLHLSNLDAKRKFKSRPFQCNLCGRRTSTEKNMIIHQRRFHSPESDCATTICEICQKRILSRNLKQHMIIHSESHSHKSRPFQCKDCGKRTSSEKNMQTHIDQFHTPESRYLETTQCEICQKRILKKNIQQHSWVHTQNRYKCDHCDQTYKHKQTLRKHIYKVHPNAEINNHPSISNSASHQTTYPNQLTQHDNPVISQQSILDSSQVLQPQLTPEEEKLMYSEFLQCQSQNV